ALIGRDGRGSNPMALAALEDEILFLACDGLELRVWRSGGPAATTAPLPGPSAPCVESGPPLRLQVAGNLGYVGEYLQESRAFRLWRTDGIDAGTFALPVESQFLGMPASFGGKTIFGTGANGAGASLWETDGTVAGTRKLFDLAGVGSVDSLIPLGSEIYFTTNSMRELWRTDGTAAGTRKLVTYDDTSRQEPFRFLQLTRAGSLAYFRADLGRLYRTDGTATGTYPVFSGSGLSLTTNELVAFKGTLYFIGTSSEGRRSLWKTDGTPGGTVRVVDVGGSESPPYSSFFSPRAYPTVVGQQLFFVADDGEYGAELWRTDGTPGGSTLVRDIAPGDATSDASGLREAAGKLYFNASDGEHGFELWESDGTEAGTRMVQDITPGVSSSTPDQLAQAGGHLFFSADDGVSGRELWALPLAGPAGCVPSDRALCLAGGRFRAEIQWRDFQGGSGRGHAVSLTPDTGYFWFFDAANVEVIVKALDGQGLNGHHWVFYGALSSVEYTLTVTDTQTGAARRYINPPGRLGSVGDTIAFGPLGATGSSLSLGPAAEEWKPVAVRSRTAAVLAPCVPSSTRLCLNGGRFAVEAAWRDFQGNAGTAAAAPLTGDTGYFWFFDEKNVEVVLKVLDGQALNGKFWVFYGALSSVEYTLTVTDTQTGQMRTYRNPSGRLASVADTGAF
ncbi:MAG TPA: ELWxxDGT repeat protein, partial [Vicinamibacteria bacterium]